MPEHALHTAVSEHVAQVPSEPPVTDAEQASAVPHRLLIDVVHAWEPAVLLLRQVEDEDEHAVHKPVPGDEGVTSHAAQLPPVIAVHAEGAPDGPTGHDALVLQPPMHTAVSEHDTQYWSMGVPHDLVVPHRVVIDVAHEPPLSPRQLPVLHSVHAP